MSGDQWCTDTIELDGRDPAHPAVIDPELVVRARCQRKLVGSSGQRYSHENHVRKLMLPGGVVVEVRWFRRESP